MHWEIYLTCLQNASVFPLFRLRALSSPLSTLVVLAGRFHWVTAWCVAAFVLLLRGLSWVILRGLRCISPWWLLLQCSFVAVLYYSLAVVIALLFVVVLCIVGYTKLSFVAVLSSLIVAASILYRLLFVELNCGLGRLFDFPGDKKGFSTLVFSLLIAGIFAGKQVQKKTVFILI